MRAKLLPAAYGAADAARALTKNFSAKGESDLLCNKLHIETKRIRPTKIARLEWNEVSARGENFQSWHVLQISWLASHDT